MKEDQNFSSHLTLLEKQLSAYQGNNFLEIRGLIEATLRLLASDIYPDEMSERNPYKIKKIQLLEQVCAIVDAFLTRQSSVQELTMQLWLLSLHNVDYKFDCPWLFEEKRKWFLPIIHRLAELLFNQLNQNRPEPSDISRAIVGLSVWGETPSPDLIEKLLMKAEELHQRKIPFSPGAAFFVFDGLAKGFYPAKRHVSATRTALFETLAEKALPFLLKEDPPLKMYDTRYLNRHRLCWVERLLPLAVDPIQGGLIYMQTLFALLEEKGPVSEKEVWERLPVGFIRNRAVLGALREKLGTWTKVSTGEWEEDLLEEGVPIPAKEARLKNYYPLKTLAENIRIVYGEKTPRGVVYLIRVYTKNLTDSTFMEFHPVDVKNYLKTIRNYAVEVVIPFIASGIAHLCQQAVTPQNLLTLIDNDLAVELLWINLVFTVLCQNEKMAFTVEQKEALFERVEKIRSEEQAHALFEIQSMKWHGNSIFSPVLSKQMKEKFIHFASSATPSDFEETCYEKIRKGLSMAQQKNLFVNYICPRTGREIDIAYLEGVNRIAIHVDGPFHYHPLMGSLTLKTLFRNKCLDNVGWRSFIIHNDNKVEAIKTVVTELQKLQVPASVAKQDEKTQVSFKSS